MEGILNVSLGILIIFISSYLYVNSAEYLASKFKISREYLASVISPLFTSVPELITVLIAIIVISGNPGREEALGTVFGDVYITILLFLPLLLFIFKKRSDHDFKFLIFSITLLISLFFLINRIITGIILILAYFYFNYYVLKNKKGEMENYSIPVFNRIFGNDKSVYFQIIVSFTGIYLGSYFLLNGIVELSDTLKMDTLILSIFLIPLGTALPEILISIIWSVKGHVGMGIDNLIGESIIYSTVYLGVFSIFNLYFINSRIIYLITSLSFFSMIIFTRIRYLLIIGPVLFFLLIFL